MPKGPPGLARLSARTGSIAAAAKGRTPPFLNDVDPVVEGFAAARSYVSVFPDTESFLKNDSSN
jgi:hypothetical protein